MKTVDLVLVLVVLGYHLQASAYLKNNKFEISTQGLCVQLLIEPQTKVRALVNGKTQPAFFSSYRFLDGRQRLIISLDQDRLPILRDDQITYYDESLDAHSITELVVILDSKNQSVQQVSYDRRQDIDYGYESESSVLMINQEKCILE